MYIATNNLISDITNNLIKWFPTGIELEDRIRAIPPDERTYCQHTYLWYRRNFWYVMAACGTILLATILFDILYSKNMAKNIAKNIQTGGDNMFSKKTANVGSSISSGMSSAKAGIKAGASSIKSGEAFKKAGAGISKGVGAAATKFKDSSGMLYKWIFTLFIFFAVGVFIMPTFVMIILGILTFKIAQGSLSKTVSI